MTDENEIWRLEWKWGTAAIGSLGGMLGPVQFRLPDDRLVEPLSIAPWSDQKEVELLPKVLQRLRGEFACVPFGLDQQMNMPKDWPERGPTIDDDYLHGFGANSTWKLIEHDAEFLLIEVEYPETHPIRTLQRSYTCDPDAPKIHTSLTITARKDVDLCLALHPIFSLPSEPGGAELCVEGSAWGLSFPKLLDSTTQSVPNQKFETLEKVPGRDGKNINFSSLPLPSPNEDLIQVVATRGVVTLTNKAERYKVKLDYDPVLFPTVILWITNCGWSEFPWQSRYRALGIEPARAAFNLGQKISSDPDNRWQREGIATTLPLSANEQVTTMSAISAAAID